MERPNAAVYGCDQAIQLAKKVLNTAYTHAIELDNAELSCRIQARRETAQTNIYRNAIIVGRRLLFIKLGELQPGRIPRSKKGVTHAIPVRADNESGLGQQTMDTRNG